MEELRSTEILDKEIQADARKKAESILKNADAECEKIKSEISQRVEESKQEKEAFFNKKLIAAENDLNASLPLEKQRFAVSYLNEQVMNAINEYLKVLPEEKHIELVLKQIDLAGEKLKDKKLNAFIYGFDFDVMKKALIKKLGSNLLKCEKTEFGKYVMEDEIGLEQNEGVFLEAEDKTFRCRFTMIQIINNLLDKNRADLSDTLFGNIGQ